jgi:transcriptional regulator of acetoin/glycerol metabolism
MNVRELRSLCQRLALGFPRGGIVRLADVAPYMAAVETPERRLDESSAPSRDELAELLRSHRGNVVKLAAHYGKDRKQIYRWLEHHALAPGDFR